MSVVGWQDRTGRRVVRWHGWRGWEVVRWQFGKRGRVVDDDTRPLHPTPAGRGAVGEYNHHVVDCAK